MSGMPLDPKSIRDGSSANSDYRSQGEYGTRMNSGSDPVGNYSEDLAAFQEVLPKRYQILREIGRGGMGQVLLALDRGPNLDGNDRVAIKRMLGPIMDDSESVKRFYDEVALARELRHPNVVRMYHSEKTRLGPYIVMEYIEGKDLGVYIKERGPLNEPQAVVWFTKLAEALDEGHRKGLIHRDIKPGNILISQEGEPYLTDFGIARRISAMDKTGTGLGTGTIEYMSLEQLRNSRSESSQDIYSFGATLFHAVEGRPPFESTNLVDFITRLASESAPRTTRVSTKLADRIASSLAKNPAERPSSCQAVLAGLVDDIPVIRSPDSAIDPEQPLPKIVVEQTPGPVSRPDLPKLDKLPKKSFRIKAFGFLGLVGLVLWWLAVAEPWNWKSNHDESNAIAGIELSLPEPITNSLGMKFRLIEPGTFMMGLPENEAGRYKDETQHRVTLTKSYYLGVYEVTQEEYERLMGTNPSTYKGKRNPVENVSYDDAIGFIERLNDLPEEKAAGRSYRLPTEAEWEYACRAGSSTAYCFGDDEARLGEYAWYDKNSGIRTHPVGKKRPNGWGLYDMHGNVWEWCNDWYGEYPSGSVTDPTGASSGSFRVRRGGSWYNEAADCRSALRFRSDPSLRSSYLGFRLVLSSPGTSPAAERGQ